MKKEIVLSGVGGQGVVSVGEVMGLAASLYEENLNATMSASYGSEARGTFTKTDVIISDGEIGYPNVASRISSSAWPRLPTTVMLTLSVMTQSSFMTARKLRQRRAPKVNISVFRIAVKPLPLAVSKAPISLPWEP